MEIYEQYVGAILDGRYKIEKIIGVGGMAVVFRAFDMLMKRTVAIKMLKTEIAGDEESVRRFVNESKAVAMMSHQNIVSIYDVNVREDVKYIAMEYVEGITLRNYMSKRGRLTLREIISYTEQILSALSHAHEKGIVHRDIKPQNIMLLKNGIIKVTDFGIAKLPNAETVTMTDKAIGTVYYISPEQASGQAIDNRSDLYSLGIMMYEMATGELPFTADSPVSVAMMQINDTAKEPSKINPDIPKGLEQIIGIAMEKNADHRYQNAEDMLRQIRRLKENPNIVFRVPKHKDGEESKSIFSLITGGGPVFPIIAGVALAFFIIVAICAVYVLGKVTDATEAKGETITVKNFVGSYYNGELSDWFEKSDIYTAQIEYIYDENEEQGKILEQLPLAGSSRKVIKGSHKCEVSLTVSVGKQEVSVPDLICLDEREAKQKLKKTALNCEIKEIANNSFFRGQVMYTEPESGEKITAGSTVTLYICSGSEEGDIKVPDFKGMTEKKALAELIKLQLLPGNVTYKADKAEKGTVISQSDSKDSKVAKNTKIDFTVSGGPDFDPNDPEGKNTTKEPETTEIVTTAEEETTKDVETTEDSETTEAPLIEDTTEPTEKTEDSFDTEPYTAEPDTDVIQT